MILLLILMDPYQVLDINVDASDAEIKKAYKKMSIKYHPDRNSSPDAADKFNECSKAYELLQDNDLRNAYNQGGWELVEMIRDRKRMQESRQKVCPPYQMNIKVTLKDIYKQNKTEIDLDKIPVLDSHGKQVKTKTFKHDLQITPEMIGHRIAIEHQGIERPEYVTGTIVLEITVDDPEFEIINNDLVYKKALSIQEVFGFSITVKHPNDKLYQLSDKFDHPNNDGHQVYIIPNHGLTKKGNLVFYLTVDYSTVKKLTEKQCIDIQKELGFKNNASVPSIDIDVKKCSLTEEEYSSKMSSNRHHQMINMMESGPNCQMQ